MPASWVSALARAKPRPQAGWPTVAKPKQKTVAGRARLHYFVEISGTFALFGCFRSIQVNAYLAILTPTCPASGVLSVNERR
jgi:hypothetical protein